MFEGCPEGGMHGSMAAGGGRQRPSAAQMAYYDDDEDEDLVKPMSDEEKDAQATRCITVRVGLLPAVPFCVAR